MESMILIVVDSESQLGVNQVPQVAQGLQWVRRLEWDKQEDQSAPDPKESVRL